ncbi:aldo/keto reductase [Pantanalinema rosaneae CENA516]|uniref:aldo/keto reductase n=1 Tax=Pantanalinema rosaneae TaxID=1620701 RepID=UPI003D6E8752
MQYRRFGRTELQMPVFSCGGMRYQYKWQDVPLSDIPADNQENLAATIYRSLDVGINHIETARGYGSSELQLGQVLPQFPRDRLIVQTKVSPEPDPEKFRSKLETSLANLQLPYVDLLGIHGINTPELIDWTVKPGGCLEVVRQFQKAGKIRFVGFSTHAPTEVIVQAIATDQFDYVNLHWYYINQTNWAAIEAANRHDMGVFIISPTEKGGLLFNPPPRLVELCEPLSPIVFNDLFCLNHPQVHTLSIGAANPQNFDEHLKTLAWLDRADEILPSILQRLEQAAIERLGADWYHTWHVGLPPVDQTPGGLNLRVILWLRNLAIAYDMVDYAKMRYSLLGNGGHWFPGVQATDIDSAALQACLSQSPHADKIPQFLIETHELLGGQELRRLSQQST